MDGPLSAAGNCLACGKGPRSFSRRSRPFSPGQPGALAASGRAALAKAGPFAYKTFRHGAWRSMVAHLLWEQGVAGSNPVAPTIKNHEVIPQDVVWPLFFADGIRPAGRPRTLGPAACLSRIRAGAFSGGRPGGPVREAVPARGKRDAARPSPLLAAGVSRGGGRHGSGRAMPG